MSSTSASTSRREARAFPGLRSVLALVLAAALAPVAAHAQDALPDSAPSPSVPSATLRVETKPSGLQVEVDGIPVGRSPVGPLALPPGAHRVTAIPADPRRFGTPVTEARVTIQAGVESVVRLDLRPPVVLRTEPEPALVTLTGRMAADSLLGSTPLSVRPSVIEPYGLRFALEAFADTTIPGAAFVSATGAPRVSLRRIAAAPTRIESSPRVPLYRKRWVQWTLVGIGAVLTAAAAVWHDEADDTYEEYLASSNVEEIPGLYDRTIELDRRATASFIAGQAAMITGGLLLLTGQSE